MTPSAARATLLATLSRLALAPPSLSGQPSADDLTCLAEHVDQVRAAVDSYFAELARCAEVRDVDDLVEAAERARDDEAERRADAKGWARAHLMGVD